MQPDPGVVSYLQGPVGEDGSARCGERLDLAGGSGRMANDTAHGQPPSPQGRAGIEFLEVAGRDLRGGRVPHRREFVGEPLEDAGSPRRAAGVERQRGRWRYESWRKLLGRLIQVDADAHQDGTAYMLAQDSAHLAAREHDVVGPLDLRPDPGGGRVEGPGDREPGAQRQRGRSFAGSGAGHREPESPRGIRGPLPPLPPPACKLTVGQHDRGEWPPFLHQFPCAVARRADVRVELGRRHTQPLGPRAGGAALPAAKGWLHRIANHRKRAPTIQR